MTSSGRAPGNDCKERVLCLRGNRVRVHRVAALACELIIRRCDDRTEKDVGGTLGFVLVGVEVQAAEIKKPVQSRKHAEALALREHTPEFRPLVGYCAPSSSNSMSSMPCCRRYSSFSSTCRTQKRAMPCKLLVGEPGHALGSKRRPAQVHLLALESELRVDSRRLGAGPFLGIAQVGGAQAADDVRLVSGVCSADGGGDTATDILDAVLATCVDALGDCFHGLLGRVEQTV